MSSQLVALPIAFLCFVAAVLAGLVAVIIRTFPHVLYSLNNSDSKSGAGGQSLVWIGGVIWFIQYNSMAIRSFFSQYVFATVTCDSQDDTFRWVVAYLLESGHAQFTASVTASTRPNAYPGDISWTEIRDNGNEETEDKKAYYLPGDGTNYFIYKNTLMWYMRQNTNPSGENMNRGQRSSNTLTISKLGRSKEKIYAMVEEARIMSVNKDKMKTIVFVVDRDHWQGGWRRSRARPTRSLSTVVLEKGLAESIIDDIKEFFNSEKWYADRGIPYRRGYLFYGHPGTGKTSLVTALAGELRLNIFIVSLTGSGMTDDGLAQKLATTSSRCILLLEDVDAAFGSRSANEASEDPTDRVSRVTLSGLLNALDGAAAQEGRIVVMTTNHIEKLDPALIRPGRVDRKIFFDLATQWQARDLFLQFFPGSTHRELAEDFSKAFKENKVSMAAIQGYLMLHKSSPKKAASCAAEWVVEELKRMTEEALEKERRRKAKDAKEKEKK
ncbi:P-loop containing nucleoside triphosphate hydrolase protein [Cladochytrium replicatum]|nr:P-loop containing nucleoside triphosphate hydrolase protein [Cladochytrium replicatum]